MSLVFVAPELLESAAADLENIRSSLTAAHAAAAIPTTGIAAAGADDVSAAVAALFGEFGEEYQALSAQVSTFHQQFVQTLISGAGSYQATEAASASPLQSIEQDVLGIINAPTEFLFGAPIISAPPLQILQQYALALINAPTETFLGRPLIGTGSSVSLGGALGTGKAPLTMYAGTEPIVNASVGTGSPVPLLVDTGSTGLVIPFQDVGGVLGVLQLGLPTGVSIGGYSGGIDYLYATYNAPVNFGGGLVTTPTPVDVEFFAFPTSISSALSNGFTFQSYFASDGVSGVLGVGPNAGGPGPSIATQALPTGYNQGLLINETGSSPYIQIADSNPGTHILNGTLTGAPITNLEVSIGGTSQTISSTIDSGGVYGTIPSSLGYQPGDTITVYNGLPPLYSYTPTGATAPEVITSGLMNTGAEPYLNNPIYISYSPSGEGTLTFDS